MASAGLGNGIERERERESLNLNIIQALPLNSEKSRGGKIFPRLIWVQPKLKWFFGIFKVVVLDASGTTGCTHSGVQIIYI